MEEDKKKKRLIIIIALVLLFLLASSSAVYLLTRNTAPTKVASSGPIVSFVVKPESVIPGERAKLLWSSDAASCFASGDEPSWFSIPDPTDGSADTNQITTDQTFSITCVGPTGTTTKSITVSVIHPESAGGNSTSTNEFFNNGQNDPNATSSASSKIACVDLKRDLAVGSTGTDVSALQKFLVSQQDLSATPNGHFGPATKTGVKNFQSAVRFSATGAVNAPTRTAIKRISCDGTSYADIAAGADTGNGGGGSNSGGDTGNGGGVTAPDDTTDPSFPPRVTFSVSSANTTDTQGKPITISSSIIVPKNTTVTISWSAFNTRSCIAENSNPVWPSRYLAARTSLLSANAQNQVNGGTVSLPIAVASTLSLSCIGAGGNTSKSIKIDVAPPIGPDAVDTSTPPPPTISLFSVTVASTTSSTKTATVRWRSDPPKATVATDPAPVISRCYASVPLIVPSNGTSVSGWGGDLTRNSPIIPDGLDTFISLSPTNTSTTAVTYTITCQTDKGGIASKSKTVVLDGNGQAYKLRVFGDSTLTAWNFAKIFGFGRELYGGSLAGRTALGNATAVCKIYGGSTWTYISHTVERHGTSCGDQYGITWYDGSNFSTGDVLGCNQDYNFINSVTCSLP
jgi:peptidoglycan hydrolase-like protein with peptidoglycan-binding domain